MEPHVHTYRYFSFSFFLNLSFPISRNNVNFTDFKIKLKNDTNFYVRLCWRNLGKYNISALVEKFFFQVILFPNKWLLLCDHSNNFPSKFFKNASKFYIIGSRNFRSISMSTSRTSRKKT